MSYILEQIETFKKIFLTNSLNIFLVWIYSGIEGTAQRFV
jgi:hypothetical protein